MARSSKRFFVAALSTVCGLAALCVSAGASTTSRSAAPTPLAPTVTQTFTGRAVGTIGELLDGQLPFKGNYSSSGQLGVGYLVTTDRFINSTAVQFTRSDGLTLAGYANVTDDCGAIDLRRQQCWSVDLSGTADIAHAHVAMLVTYPKPGTNEGGAGSIAMHGSLTLRRRIGYVTIDRAGQVHTFGGIASHGDGSPLVPAVDIGLTPFAQGYWIADPLGGTSAHGDARFLGDPHPPIAATDAVVSMSATPSGNGYWLFTAHGRVVPIGDAHFFGDLVSKSLKGRVVDSIATPSGKGYYMVGSDGGVFAFGDARFRGSMGAARLNGPIVALVPTAANSGYWLVGSDGGVFSFNAPFYGSMGGTRLNAPVTAAVSYGGRYLMVASDGGVFNFSRAPYLGNAITTGPADPIVSAAAVGE